MRRAGVAGCWFVGACAAWTLCAGGLRAQEAVGEPVPDAPAGEASGEGEQRKITVLYLLQKGGALMYPLYVCSLLTVAFGIERGLKLRRRHVLPQPVVDGVRAVIADDGHIGPGTLLSEMRSHPSPLSRILGAGLRKAGRPLVDIEKAIISAGDRECSDLRRNNRVLSVVAGIAPLLGLLGTVFGMIQAFITVAAQEEALGRTELLAEGIYQALVTTAVGLCIAIPCLVMYHIYAEKVDRMVSEMDTIATELVDRLSEG